ncbi:MAG: hypothetical protein E7632_11150 [Ruminococcaceae bacterium]|nr:hypothetical protein [Oscillospiraceae bacterium]
MNKRILSILLTLVMAFGLLPVMSVPTAAVTYRDMVSLGTSGIDNPTPTAGSTNTTSGTYYVPNSYIYFGKNGETPIKWRVLKAGQTNTGSTGMFLLSEYVLATDVQFGSSDVYQGSNAQSWCSAFAASGFSTAEQAILIGNAKSDAMQNTLFGVYWDVCSLTTNDKVFFLSAEELKDYVGSYKTAPGLAAATAGNTSNVAWWLRSPVYDTYAAISSNQAGRVDENGIVLYEYPSEELGARPAINLDKSTILFTTPATALLEKEFGGINNKTNEWKLTLADSSSMADGTSISASEVVAGGSLTISHKALSAISGAYTNVTAMLIKNEKVVGYGSINSNPSATSSTITFPANLSSGDYTLRIYGEDWNGKQLTNYATGTPFETTITVIRPASVTTSPEAKTLTYTGAAQALVSAGTAESGTMQYALGDNDTNAPTIGWGTIIPAKTDAGTYYVWYKAVNQAGETTPVCVTVTIKKAFTSVFFSSSYNPSREFNGTTLMAVTSPYVNITGATFYDVVFTWYKDSVSDANKLSGLPSDAGTYYVTAHIPENANRLASSDTSSAITIFPMTANATITLSQTVFTYDGNAKQPTVTSVRYQGYDIPESEYTVSYEHNVNVGTASVILADNPGGNFNVSGTATFEIHATLANLTAAPTAIANLIYTGAPRELVNAGTTASGRILYSLSETGTFSDSIPTGTAAGDYTVWYYVEGDANHTDSAKDFVTVSIGKATPAYTVPTGLTAAYGQKLSDVTLPAGFGWTDGNLSVGDLGVHTFTVTFTPNDLSNYNAVENISVDVTVTKATADASMTTAAGNLIQGGESIVTLPALPVNSSHGTPVCSEPGVTATIDSGNLIVSGSNSVAIGQTYTVTIPVTSDIYEDYSITVTLTGTAKRQVQITPPTPQNGAYTGAAQSGYTGAPSADNYSGTLVVTYTGRNGTAYGPTAAAPVHAGDYTVTFSVPDDDPACAGSVSVDFSIAKAGTAAAPVIAPAVTTFEDSLEITITCATDGAAICFTTDGSDPLTNGTPYTAPFTITEDTTVRAIALHASMDASEVSEQTFIREVVSFNGFWYILVKLHLQRFGITASMTEGGTITPDGTAEVKFNKDQAYAFTPDDGYRIADVIVDGKSVGPVDAYTFENVRDDHTIAVIFEKIPQ